MNLKCYNYSISTPLNKRFLLDLQNISRENPISENYQKTYNHSVSVMSHTSECTFMFRKGERPDDDWDIAYQHNY